MDGMVKEHLKVISLIPARGGSKSIPRKNIKILGGYPLLAYSIAAAKLAESVDRVIVSTDDSEIAEIAVQFGAETPFIRPAGLATDETPDLPVFEHALEWLMKNEGFRPDVIIHLRPTAPFRPPYLIDDSVRSLLDNPAADCVRCVVPAHQNPYKMYRIVDGMLKPLLRMSEFAEPYNMPRQKLPSSLWHAGHVEAIKYSTIMEKKSMSGDCIIPLVIDDKYAIDIDTWDEWNQAEWLMDNEKINIVKPIR